MQIDVEDLQTAHAGGEGRIRLGSIYANRRVTVAGVEVGQELPPRGACRRLEASQELRRREDAQVKSGVRWGVGRTGEVGRSRGGPETVTVRPEKRWYRPRETELSGDSTDSKSKQLSRRTESESVAAQMTGF